MYGEEYIERAKERKMIYEFISGLCLRPPSEAMLSMIKDGSILESVQLRPESKAYHELEKFVKESAGAPDLEIELEAEHTALFMMPGDVIPHEAVFLDEKQRLGGKVTISVKEFYEMAGAESLEGCIQMPDHIGMELEFMKFLCGIECESLQKGETDALKRCIEFQRGFLKDHLLKWAIQCLEKIIGYTKSGFYKAFAYLIIEFLEEEEHVVNLHMMAMIEEGQICEKTI